MNRLLSANFARLWRSKIFYGLGLFMIGYSVMFYRDVYMTIHVKHKEYTNWNFAFFGGLLPIGIALAVFVSFYIGTEYSSGTIRNKIATGHSRFHIYMANLLVCYAAAVITMTVYCLISLMMGVILVGKVAISGIRQPGWGVLITLAIIMAYTAALVFIAMIDMNIARTGIVSLLSAMLILGAGMLVIQRLEMPEYTTRMEEVQDEYGKVKMVEKTVLNSNYLSGERRRVYECARLLLPSSQVVEVNNNNAEYSVKMPLCMLGEAFLFTVAGIWIFCRRDVR